MKRNTKRKADDVLQKELSELEYAVTQHSATERPFSHAYTDEFRPGILCRYHLWRASFYLRSEIRLLVVVGPASHNRSTAMSFVTMRTIV